jgi:hypothetical protein
MPIDKYGIKYNESDEPTAITPDKLQPASPITLPEPAYEPLPTVSNFAQDYYDAETATKDAEAANTGLATTLTDLMGQETGKEADTIAEQTKAGVFDKLSAYRSLLSQINEKKAGYDKLSADLEVGTRGAGQADIRASMLFGQQGAIARAKASEIEMLNSQAQTLAGDYNMALASAQRAVDLKYQPIEDNIKILETQYNMNKDMLERIDKKRADALAIMLDERKTQMEAKKQNEKDMNAIALEAAKGGAPQSVIDAIKNATDVNQAIGYASGFLSTALDLQLKQMAQTQFNADRTYAEQVRGNKASEGISWYNAETARLNADSSTKTDKNIKDIISMYPASGEVGGVNNVKNGAQWDQAAAAIDRKYGAGTATQYDSLLKSVYAPTASNKPMNATEAVSYNYAQRMEEANKIFDKNEKYITGMDKYNYLYQTQLPNMYQDPKVQEQVQAETDFVNAVLRKESGAVINPDEFVKARKQYFYQPGDSLEVQKNKKALRESVIDNFYKGAGVPYDPQVLVISPEGKHGYIPKSELKEALSQGYKQQ